MNNLPKWSIIICSFNGSTRLPTTLSMLRTALESEPSHEVILVDNSSTDDTRLVSDNVAKGLSFASYTSIVESRRGLTYARIAGLNSAQGEFVAFVDDDNWLLPKYFPILSDVFATHPEITAVGCANTTPSAMKLPEWWTKFAYAYAVGRCSSRTGAMELGSQLWGAGIAFRRRLLRKLTESDFSPVLTGRSGSIQLAGDDTELVFALGVLQQQVWHENQVLLIHAINEHRLNTDFLAKMFDGFGRSAYFLQIYHRAARGCNTSPLLDPLLLLKDVVLLAKDILMLCLRGDFRRLSIRLKYQYFFSKWAQYFLDRQRRLLLRENLMVLAKISEASK